MTDSEAPKYRWEDMGMILWLPDMMVQDRWEEAAHYIGDAGWWIAALAVVPTSPALVALIYTKSRLAIPEADRLDSTWLGPALFERDMSIATVVVRKEAVGSLTEALERTKGTSAYPRRTSAAMRSVSPISNRCMSLLHTPEDHSDLVRTAGLIFCGDLLERIRRGEDERSLDLADVARIRGYRGMAQERDPYEILSRTAQRILTLLYADRHLVVRQEFHVLATTIAAEQRDLGDSTGRARRDQAHANMDGWRSAVKALPPVEPAALVPAGPADDHAHKRLVGRRRELFRCLEILLNPPSYDARTAEMVLADLRDNGLYVGEWEAHRLMAAMVFFHT